MKLIGFIFILFSLFIVSCSHKQEKTPSLFSNKLNTQLQNFPIDQSAMRSFIIIDYLTSRKYIFPKVKDDKNGKEKVKLPKFSIFIIIGNGQYRSRYLS